MVPPGSVGSSFLQSLESGDLMSGSSCTFAPTHLTALRKLTDELTDEDRLINLFFTLSPDLFFVADGNGRLLKVNDAWRQLGWTDEELREKTLWECMHIDDRAKTKYTLNIVRDNGITTLHNRFQNKSTNEFIVVEWNLIKSHGLLYGVGRPVPVQCLHCNSSERWNGSAS